MPVARIDIAVVGAGQAGLAMGRQLQSLTCGVQIFERNARIGDSWRNRFDSLTLFSPRELSCLPGLPFPGKKGTFPTKDEVADYLERYADHFALPVVTGTGVANVKQIDGGFALTLGDGVTVRCRLVVIASGAFQEPFVPPIARRFSRQVVQYRIDDYRNPSQLPAGPALVVGDGPTGRQIALEMSNSREVVLATGRFRTIVPHYVFGKHTVWWMEALGLSKASRESVVGRFLRRTDPFPGLALTRRNLRRRGMRIVGRLTGADGTTASFSRGESATVSSIVWATGYQDSSDWVEIPAAKDAHGDFIERRGVTPVPNLFHVGRNWQWTRSSGLMIGVDRDAKYLFPMVREGLRA